MAKITARNAREIGRFIDPTTGAEKLVTSDGRILVKIVDRWNHWARLKATVSPHEYLVKLAEHGYLVTYKA